MPLKGLPWPEDVMIWDKAISALKVLEQGEFALWKLYKKSIAIIDSADQAGWFSEEMIGKKPTDELFWAMIILQDDKIDSLKIALQKVLSKAEEYMALFRDELYDWEKYMKCSELEKLVMFPHFS